MGDVLSFQSIRERAAPAPANDAAEQIAGFWCSPAGRIALGFIKLGVVVFAGFVVLLFLAIRFQ